VQFLTAVRNISFWKIYISSDVNTAVSILTDSLTTILNYMAPIKTIQVRSKYCPWLSSETKHLQQERNNLQKKAFESNNPEDWRRYKEVRNKVNNRLKHEKINWRKDKLVNLEDHSQMWKNIKSWLGWSSGGPPKKLVSEGTLSTKLQILPKL
jgi:hypothetical protein